MLAEARTEVSYADHKASMVLAALGIGFGAVVGGLLAGDWKPSDQGRGEWLWWLGAATALAAVTCAAAAVWPRYSNRTDPGVYYWGQVARLPSYEDMCKKLDDPSRDDSDRRRHQLWALSKIVMRKYRLLRWAFVLAGASVVVFGLSAAAAS